MVVKGDCTMMNAGTFSGGGSRSREQGIGT